MKLARVVACVGLFLLVAASSDVMQAQEYRARLQGIVTDQSQAAMAGVTVTLRNVATGVEATQQSDQTGHYLFDLIEPGTYVVIATANGFGRFIQENVVLQTRADASVNISLNPGSRSANSDGKCRGCAGTI